MRAIDTIRLLVLGAVWGASFLFGRLCAPALGPAWTACIRTLLAGVLLLIYAAAIGKATRWREFGKNYAIIGLINSALPFLLFAFAAARIPAGYMATMNATAPMFGLGFEWWFLGVRPTGNKLIGTAIGFTGVMLVAGAGPIPLTEPVVWGLLAAATAGMMYGYSGVLIKRRAGEAPSLGLASCSQLFAGLWLLPLTPVITPPGPITTTVVLAVLAMAVLSTAFAYVLYFQLVASVGASRALTVTFLIPVFGITWGVIFLHETVTWPMAAGVLLVIAGVVLCNAKRHERLASAAGGD